MDTNNIYAKLNKEVELVDYKGGVTNTATVNINDNIITVDAKIDVTKIETQYNNIITFYNSTKIYLDQIQKEIKDYSKKFAEQDTKIAEVTNLVNDISTKVIELKSYIDTSLESQFSILQSEIDALKIEIETSTIELNNKINSINVRINELDSKITQLTEEVIAKVTIELNTLRTQLRALETKVDSNYSELNSKITTLSANTIKKFEDVNKELTNLNSKVETTKTELTSKVNELKSEVDTGLQAVNIKIESVDSKTSKNINRIDADVATLNNRVDNISTTILPLIEQKIKELADAIDIKIAAIEKELKDLESSLTVRISNVETQVANKVNQIDFSKFKSSTEIALNKKGGGMYYDSTGELDPSGQSKSYWYMTSNNSQSDPTIIAGPYNFGTGGGGGGGGGGGTTTKVAIYADEWPTTISYGTECKIKVVWSSYKEDVPTGNGTITLYINDTLKYTQRNTKQGEVYLDITQYLMEGTNTVEVRATDAYGTSDKVIQEISTVKISLSSLFDDNRVFANTINYTYIPFGQDILKTVYFIVDGMEYGTQITQLSDEQLSFDISGLSHGSHTLEVYFKCTVAGNEVVSNKLFYDLMYEVEGNTDPIIVSTFNQLNQEQYTAFTIPYRVYTPNRVVSIVQLYINGALKSTETIEDSTKVQKWETKPDSEGIFLYEIVCGVTVKRFTITVSASEVPVVPVTGDQLKLALTSTGRSNTEEHPEIWEDTQNHISCNLTGFNFVSDGWLKDESDNTVLRVTGDARVEIPIKIFAQDFTQNGKTIEFEFASRTIRDYETVLVSCLDNADYFERKAIPVELTGRTKSFIIDSFNSNTFKTKVDSKIGTYTFSYSGTAWKLGDDEINLADYGITLKEIKIEPEPTDIKDTPEYLVTGDKVTIKYTMEGRGFSITPQVARIRSQLSELSTQYKEDEHVRVSFVVEKKSEFRIIYMYINGIMSGATQYPTNDSFNQVNPVTITIGSSDATIDLYNIRVYDLKLSRKQIVNNWIADTQSGDLKKQRYLHNDNYNASGEIVISKLPSDIPYIIWDMDDLPRSKGDKRPGNARYVDQTNSEKNFTAINAQYNVQGTSSSVYPVKNIRIKYKQGYYDDEKKKPWPTFEWYDDNANVIKNYPINDGIPDSYFTYKVDYASSEGANNVELTKLYNDASKSIGVLSPPQKINNKVRVGIDGFPIVAFHRGADGKDVFLTKANFNNDKANDNVYGFTAGDESWEITNNSAAEANFKSPVTAETLDNAFELRYPDTKVWSGDISKLSTMTTWVVSTDPEQATNNELVGIRLLEEKPEDWDTWFTSYLQKVNNKYENVIKLGPAFKKNKYYWRVIEEGKARYFLLEEEPDDWRTNFENYFYKEGEIYKPIEGTIPEFELNKYYRGAKFTYSYIIRAEDGTYSSKTASKGFAYDSVDYRLTKFKAELATWFNVDSTIFYYIYTLLYLMIDSRAKNAFPTYFISREPGDGGDRWFWLPYDMDTAIGINNEGKLVFDYNLEDTDKQDGSNVFNGQDSVMWNNLRKTFDGEIGQMYASLRTTGSLISFEETESRFEKHQAKWSESIFNEDSYIKYIKVLMEKGDNYLEMLQGSKAEQRKWWLYNRFKYLDSKYLAGEAKSDFLQFRAYGKADITIVPYADIYATVSYANSANAVVSARAKRGEAVTLPNPLPTSASDQETYIYSASQLKSIGDLSPFKPDTVKVANAVKLQELKVGDNSVVEAIPAVAESAAGTVFDESISYYTKSEEPVSDPPGYLIDKDQYKYTLVSSPVAAELNNYYLITEFGQNAGKYENPHLTELTLGKNVLLKKLDVRNCINLKQAVDISGCTNIEEVYFDGTAITGLLMSDGGVLKKLHLPDSLRNLTIKNQKLLQELQIAGTTYIQTLDLENIPAGLIDYTTIIKGMGPGHEVKIIGLTQDFDATSPETAMSDITKFYDLLDSMKHKDAKGEIVPKAEVTGNIYVKTLYYKDYVTLLERYPEITINCTTLICHLEFYQYDDERTTIWKERYINAGEILKDIPEDPFKESTDEFDYIFTGWDFNFEEPIWTDLIVKPTYKSIRRKYWVHFNSQSSKVEVPDVEVLYGQPVPEPEVKEPIGTEFNGWFTSPACLIGEEYDFSQPVKKEFTLYGKWTDLNKPTAEVIPLSATTYTFILDDNLAVKAWALTETAEIKPETKWNELETPKAPYSPDEPQVVTKVGTYYLWAKDIYDKVSEPAMFNVYNISREVTTGATIIIKDNLEEIVNTDYILQTIPITIEFSINDAYYENLKCYVNNEEVFENPYTIEKVKADLAVKATCNPRTFTVTFDMKGRGKQEPNQFIIYNNLISKPENQYEYDAYEQQGYIIDETDWFTDPNFTAQSNWNFNENKVDKDTILYARWRAYQAPSEITVNITEANPSVTCNIIQEVSRGFEIDWGDEEVPGIETKEGVGAISISHTYSTVGTKVIKLTAAKEEIVTPGKTKTCYNSLGINSYYHPVIEPASVITGIKFAYNVRATNYILCGATSLKTVELSPYMSEITTGAFYNCTGLETITIPDSIWKINSSAFYNCSALVQNNGEWTLGANVKVIDHSAFTYCEKITKFNLPDSITSLGQYAFSDTGIVEFIVPPKVTTLAQGLLAATPLETLVIADSVTEINAGICTGCAKLNKVIFEGESVAINQSIFQGCSLLTSVGPIGSGADIEFAWKDSIPAKLFVQNTSIVSVEMSDSMTKIEKGSFTGCSNLSSFVFSDSLKTIEFGAFYNCGKLGTVEFPNSLETIEEQAFYNCIRLTINSLPESLTYIGKEAFVNCFLTNSVDGLNIPANINFLGYKCFDHCQYLKKVNIWTPGWMPKVDPEEGAGYWFNACTNLVDSLNPKLHILTTIPDESKAIEAFGNYWNYYAVGGKIPFVSDLQKE